MNSSSLLATGIGIVLAASTATTITLTKDNNLRLLEVYFYDTTSADKRIRLNLDYLGNNSYTEYYDTTNHQWKYISEETSDSLIYKNLHNIASKYVTTQHSLNTAKAYKKADSELDQLCKSGNCCKDPTKCNCKLRKCTSCVCCYSDNSSTSQDCCCKAGSTCTWTEFQKKQKTFNELIKNIRAAENNLYFHPVQAHIKLMDSEFNDFSTSTETSGSQNSKIFYGTLTYSFVDYYYKLATYKSSVLGSNTSNYTQLSSDTSKPNYFSNIPQRFKYKNLGTSGDAVDNSDIDTVFKKVTDKKWRIKATSNSTTDICCCQCEDSGTDYSECLVNRNFVFLEKDSNALTNVQSKIKNIEDCCKTSN